MRQELLSSWGSRSHPDGRSHTPGTYTGSAGTGPAAAVAAPDCGSRHCSHCWGPRRVWNTSPRSPHRTCVGTAPEQQPPPWPGTGTDFRFTSDSQSRKAKAVWLDSCFLSVTPGKKLPLQPPGQECTLFLLPPLQGRALPLWMLPGPPRDQRL